MKTVTYRYRGLVERFSRGSYRWFQGYSANSENGNPLYPWCTKQECRQDAKTQGARALFMETT